MVAHFVRGHSDMCTFCRISGNGNGERETPHHLFSHCNSVEETVTNAIRNILNNNDDLNSFRPSYYFGVPKYENESKNRTLLVYLLLVKKYIWDCKLRNCLPNPITCIQVCNTTLLCSSKCNRKLQQDILNSGLNLEIPNPPNIENPVLQNRTT